MNRLFRCKRVLRLSFVLLALLAFAVPSMAAPVEGPSGMLFYSPPNPLPAGSNGDLIWYRAASLAPVDAPFSNAWKVMYHSVDALGAANVVTGAVIVPTSDYEERGDRPVVLYAVGTHGLDQSCAPSNKLEAGIDYESENIAKALNKGYAVLVTDNPGYTLGDIPTYMAGKAQGHALLDIYAAALQVPGIQISSSAPVAIWGFSQGGQTACFAGELQPTYAPDMDLVGVAAGGVPADFFQVAEYLDGNNGSAFLLETVIGLWAQYPDGIPLEELINDEGADAVELGMNVCVFEGLFAFMNTELSTYVIDNMPLDELMAIPSVEATLQDQELGNNPIDVPVFLYHGTADEFIPLEQSLELKEKYCDLNVDTQYMVYNRVEHITTQFQAAPEVLSWISDRISGDTAPNTCGKILGKPKADPNPVDGDFLFSLREWKLDAMVHLNRLDQDVFMPEDSSFSAETNMTQNTLTGTMSIPTFKAPIRVVLPLKVELSVIPVGEATGTASLDNDGVLHIEGNAYANIAVTGVGVSRLAGIPVNLITEEPVDFGLSLAKPVSCLGAGKTNFSGLTTYPPMVGGAFDTLFTTLMSGPGQGYSFTVIPPEPKIW